jgi:hypothetical protein
MTMALACLQDVEDKIDKICEMAGVMQRAINLDDEAVAREQQLLSQLQLENSTLREILHIAVNGSNLCRAHAVDTATQTQAAAAAAPLSSDDEDPLSEMTAFNLDSSIITVKDFDTALAASTPAAEDGRVSRELTADAGKDQKHSPSSTDKKESPSSKGKSPPKK